jgi:hypothetical protein
MIDIKDTEMYKLSQLITKNKPSGVDVTPLFWKRSPKSREGGKIHNNKILSIFMKCFSITHKSTRIKTYSMLNRLINNPMKLKSTNDLKS